MNRPFNPFSSVSELHIEVSDSCNLNCRYCYFVDKKPYKTPFPLETFDNLMSCFFSKTDSDVTLVFHGGEPLMNDADWISEACRIARRRSLENGHKVCFHLQTNGTLLSNAHITTLVNEDFSVNVSFDGPRKVHNQARGGYDATVKAIEKLNDAGILTGIITVIGKHNYNLAEEMVKEIISLGVKRYHFNVGSILNGNNSLILSDKEIFEFLTSSYSVFMETFRDSCNWVLLGKLRRFVSGYIPELSCDSPICGAAIHKIHLRQNGDYFPCGSCVSTKEGEAAFRLGRITDNPKREDFERTMTAFHKLYFNNRGKCVECPGRTICDFLCPAFDGYDPITASNRCSAYRQFERFLEKQDKVRINEVLNYYSNSNE